MSTTLLFPQFPLTNSDVSQSTAPTPAMLRSRPGTGKGGKRYNIEFSQLKKIYNRRKEISERKVEKICGNGPRGDRTNAQERFGNHPYKLSRLQENNNKKELCRGVQTWHP